MDKNRMMVFSHLGDVFRFSAISLKCLKAGSFSFYLLHVTLLNYSEEQRRRHILSGRTISAYLVVSFWRDNVSETSKGLSAAGRAGQKKRLTTLEILQALHGNVGIALNELVQ